MTVLITGGSGQLGYHLQSSAASDTQILCPSRNQLDLSDDESIDNYLAANKPTSIINAGAYTAVDKAESEPDLAFQINAKAVERFSAYSHDNHVPLIQVSTDFVFAGEQGAPYHIDAPTGPSSVYGHSKLAGEKAALKSPYARVLRTSWVYSEHGHNFVKTMLRFGAERDQLNIVADQVGSPCYAANLAKVCWALLSRLPEQRCFHYSDAGVCSWYDFTLAILEQAKAQGMVEQLPAVGPLRSEDYPTAAKRPHYSVLDNSQTYEQLQFPAIHWREALAVMLKQLKLQN